MASIWTYLFNDFLPGTSDIDWCERNYVNSRLIAEFYNTVSNAIYLLMPPLLIYLFRGYSQAVSGGINVVWLLLMVVGLGSIYFHATLSFAGQLIDELAIAWVVLAGFTIWMPPHLLQRWPLNGSRRKLGQIASVLGILVIALALVKPVLNAFILISMALPAVLLLFQEMKECSDRRAWRLCRVSVFWLLVAVVLWLSDRANCHFWLRVNFPYLHSLWHVLIFVAAYVACVLFAFLYACREHPQLRAHIHYWPSNECEHGVPYVHIESIGKVFVQ